MALNKAGYQKDATSIETYFRVLDLTEADELFKEGKAYFQEIDDWNTIAEKKGNVKIKSYSIEGLAEYLHLSCKADLETIAEKSLKHGKVIQMFLNTIQRQLVEKLISNKFTNSQGVIRYLESNFEEYYGETFQGIRALATKKVKTKKFLAQVIDVKAIDDNKEPAKLEASEEKAEE